MVNFLVISNKSIVGKISRLFFKDYLHKKQVQGILKALNDFKL